MQRCRLLKLTSSIEKDKENKEEKSETGDVKSHTLMETPEKAPITMTKKLLESEQSCDIEALRFNPQSTFNLWQFKSHIGNWG